MAWIEIHQSLPDHRKTLALGDALDLPIPLYAMAHVIAFWLWALDNAPDGNLSSVSARTIARVARWPGDPAVFVNAMVDVGFLNADEDGALSIHDWGDYAGRLMERRRASVERTRKWRETHADGTHNERVPNAATVPNRTVPNRTVPNLLNTESVLKTESAPAAPVSVQDRPAEKKEMAKPENPDVAAFLSYHSERLHPTQTDRASPEERKKVAARLKVFSLEDMKRAVDKFYQHRWWMQNHSWRDAAWFCHSDGRIRQFLKMPIPEDKEADRGAYQHSASQRPIADPATTAGSSRLAAHD